MKLRIELIALRLIIFLAIVTGYLELTPKASAAAALTTEPLPVPMETRKLTPEIVMQFNQAQKREVLDVIKSEKTLLEKEPYLVLAGGAQDVVSTGTLLSLFFRPYQSTAGTPTGVDIRILGIVPKVMGFYASHDESARLFLAGGLQEDFWVDFLRTSPSPAASEIDFLVDQSIQGLAISDLSGATQFLDNLRENASRRYLFVHGIAIGEAYLLSYIRRSKGEKGLWDYFLDPAGKGVGYNREYRKTNEGAQIWEWMISHTIGNIPPEENSPKPTGG